MNGIPLQGKAKGTAGEAYETAKRRGAQRLDFLLAYLTELYAFAPTYGINPDVLVAQADLETDSFRSVYYVRDGNVAGFGAFDDGSNLGLQYSAVAAARGQVIHHCAYIGIYVPTGDQAFDPRYQAVFLSGYDGDVKTTADYGNGKWATDPKYADKLAERYKAYFGEYEGIQPVATYTTTIPGMPGGPLKTDYPIHINLVPAKNTRQRPGIKAAKPRRSVQHGSANPTSTAEGEIQYIVNGAGGRQASYHYSTDWDSAAVGVPVDEVTWQAADGSGPGNMNGLSNELAENKAAWADPAKRARMIYIAGDLMGRSAARLNISKPEYHWTFNAAAKDRHRCPDFILFAADHAATQAAYEKQWYASKADELKRMGGEVPDPVQPTYAAPSPIPALLDTDLSKNDTAQGVTSADGTDFIFVSDVVEATKDTPRLRYSSSDERVGPDIKKGERFVVAWIFKYEDKYMYLTPWWTRVRAEDCKRVSDAPLITQEP